MPRALWKGAISFGLVSVPVELHSAKKRAAELDMTMLDKRDLAPVGYKRVNKSTGKEVPWDDVVKGYEYKDDKYVVLSDEDFRRANPEASKTVDILAIVDLREIDPQFFDTPYYLKPEKRGEKAYALLRETLAKAGKAGIASVVIRTKQYLAALVPQDDLLVLNTLRYAQELKAPSELEIPHAKVTLVEHGHVELSRRLLCRVELHRDVDQPEADRPFPKTACHGSVLTGILWEVRGVTAPCAMLPGRRRFSTAFASVRQACARAPCRRWRRSAAPCVSPV